MATEPEAGRPSRNQVVLVVVLAVALLAALWFLVIRPLVFVSEEGPAPPAAAPSPGVRPSPAPSPTPPPPETFEVFGAKDPFRPLVVAGGPGTPAPGAGGTVAPTATGAAGGPAPAGGQRVELLDIFEDEGVTKVQVRIGSTVYTVTVDQVFADSFKLVSVSGRCATLLHGDDKFTLCEGEEVIK